MHALQPVRANALEVVFPVRAEYVHRLFPRRQVQIGDQVDIKLHQGSFTASVTQIQEERNGEEITEL